MHKLFILLIISTFSFAKSYQCLDKKNNEVILTEKSSDYFELKRGNTTYGFVKTDTLIDFVINSHEIVYKSFDEGWTTHPWFGTKMYFKHETNFEFNKESLVGSYYSYHKVGLLSAANKEKIDFRCKK